MKTGHASSHLDKPRGFRPLPLLPRAFPASAPPSPAAPTWQSGPRHSHLALLALLLPSLARAAPLLLHVPLQAFVQKEVGFPAFASPSRRMTADPTPGRRRPLPRTHCTLASTAPGGPIGRRRGLMGPQIERESRSGTRPEASTGEAWGTFHHRSGKQGSTVYETGGEGKLAWLRSSGVLHLSNRPDSTRSRSRDSVPGDALSAQEVGGRAVDR